MPPLSRPGTIRVTALREDNGALVVMDYDPSCDIEAFYETMASLAGQLDPSITYAWWSRVVPEPEEETTASA